MGEEEGVGVEPVFFVPVISVLAVNGAHGIGMLCVFVCVHSFMHLFFFCILFIAQFI